MCQAWRFICFRLSKPSYSPKGEKKVFFPMVGPRPREAKAIARSHTAACEELAGMGPWSG